MPKDSSLESSTPFSSLPHMLYSLHDYTHTHTHTPKYTSTDLISGHTFTPISNCYQAYNLSLRVTSEYYKNTMDTMNQILYNSTGCGFRIITFVIIYLKMIIVIEYDFTLTIYQQYLVKNLITTKKILGIRLGCQ